MQLAAQAEAEKRNIGTADYLHKELDHTKKVIEEKEHIHRELNKYSLLQPKYTLCTRATLTL